MLPSLFDYLHVLNISGPDLFKLSLIMQGIGVPVPLKNRKI
jgi:hypothetical protein